MSEIGPIFRENGPQISLSKALARGGEGQVWTIQGSQNLVAKIYHKRSSTIGAKLQHMIENPPNNPFIREHNTSFAWPQTRLFDQKGQCIGFLMPHIPSTLTLSRVYHPKLRSKFAPSFHWYYLHTVARNTALLLHALHEQHYIIGDIKTDNILIHSNALVSWVDMDSLQIKTDSMMFPCTVQSDDFASPESAKRSGPLSQRHDCFALAILIHLTLLGYHPFANAPAHRRVEFIQKGQWVGNAKAPPPFAVPYSAVDLQILSGFQKVFSEPSSPHHRPQALWWARTCSQALEHMVSCTTNAHHFYTPNTSSCTWCTYAKNTTFDPFASSEKSSPLQALFQELSVLNWRGIIHLLQKYPDLRSLPLDKKRRDALALCDALREAQRALTHKDCKSPFSDKDLMDMWLKYAQTYALPAEHKESFPFPELICASTKHHDAIQTLQGYCDRLSVKGRIDPYVAEHITDLFITLKKQNVEPEHVPHLIGKIIKAEEVSSFWKKLLEALHNQNESALAYLAVKHASTLSALDMPMSYTKAIECALQHQNTIHAINKLLLNKAPHSEIEQLLTKNPSLLNSSFCHQTLLGGQTLSEWSELLKRKKSVTPQLYSALDREDYMTVARLWEPLFYEHKGLWHKLAHYAQKGAFMEKKWSPIKRAILEGEHQYLRSHWNEKEFGRIARQEGLAQQTQEAIKPIYKGACFTQHACWPYAYIENALLHVIFQWPHCAPNIPVCLIAWHGQRHPRSIIDVEQSTMAHHILHNHASLRRAIFSCKTEKAFVSIWPAAFIAETIVPVQAPLHVQSATNAYLMYTQNIRKKRGFNILHVCITPSIALHDIKLVVCATPKHTPLQTEVIEEYTVSVMYPSKKTSLKIPVDNNKDILYALKGSFAYGESIPAYRGHL